MLRCLLVVEWLTYPAMPAHGAESRIIRMKSYHVDFNDINIKKVGSVIEVPRQLSRYRQGLDRRDSIPGRGKIFSSV
jgi:hypothetical protein